MRGNGRTKLPILDAAHIRPYGAGGDHEITNGLLLRTDVHRLFDLGYVTVSGDGHFEVGRRLKEEFENGRHYYSMHGKQTRCRTRCARGRRAMRLIGIRQISSSVDTSPRSIAHRLAQVQSLPAKSGLVPASHCNDDGFSRPGNRRDGVRRWIGGREFEQLDPCKRISGKALANPRAVPSADTSARCAAGGLSQDYRRQAVRGY